jgi:hypothetical protein
MVVQVESLNAGISAPGASALLNFQPSSMS